MTDKQLVGGVDIGGTKVAVAIADIEGHIIARSEAPTTGGDGADAALERIFGAIDVACAAAGLTVPPPLGIGSPGITVKGGPNLICDNIPGWPQIDLYGRFEERYGTPCQFVNDIKAAALGEVWRGAAQHTTHAAYLGLGTGLAIGIILDGQIYEGAHGAGGEIAYWLPNPKESAEALRRGQPVATYRRGNTPLEDVLGGRSIGYQAADLLKVGRAPLLAQLCAEAGTAPTAALLFAAARQGDSDAAELVAEMSYHLAAVLAQIAMILDLEVIVIGGGVSRSADLLLAPVKRVFNEFVAFPPRVVTAGLGTDSGLYGAIRVGIDLLESTAIS